MSVLNNKTLGRANSLDIFNSQVTVETVEGVFLRLSGEQRQFQVFIIASTESELRVQSRIFGLGKVVCYRPRSVGRF